ncbi:MAG: AraC family transcriptional regulator ligand-binding domain-containing protein [Myxococcota bacterium]
MTTRDEQHQTLVGQPRLMGAIAMATLAFALSRGLTVEEIRKLTGLSGLDLVSPDARVPDYAVAKVWPALPTRPGVHIALEMATAAPFTALGGLAQGAQFAQDLRESLSFFVDNRKFIADRLTLVLEEVGDEGALVVAHPRDADDGGRTTVMGVALLTRMIKEVLRIENVLRRVEFSFEQEGAIEASERFFGVPVRYRHNRTALVFHRASLDTPVNDANLDLFRFVEQYYDQVRRRIEKAEFSSDLNILREAIAQNASNGLFTVDAAAARAGVGLRSAQRLAASHGTSVQRLIDKVREETARDFLVDGEMRTETIAALLGYSDERAFRRAFKRWTGQSPGAFRKSIRPA